MSPNQFCLRLDVLETTKHLEGNMWTVDCYHDSNRTFFTKIPQFYRVPQEIHRDRHL